VTCYTIEDNIPLPASAMAHNQRKPKTPIRLALEALNEGQSLLFTESTEWAKARSIMTHLSPGGRKFATRKLAGQGWRVWRVA
jgi:hypothetical protein